MARPKKLPPGLWLRDGVYYARFRANGRLIRKKLSTNLDAAKVILNDLRARCDKQDFGILDNDYPWDDLKNEFMRWARQSVRSHKGYEADIRQIEKYCRIKSIRQIDQAFVVNYREWRLGQDAWEGSNRKDPNKYMRVSPRTVNREVGTLQNMLNHAVAWGRIGTNPIVNVKPLAMGEPRKKRRALSLEEVKLIFENCPPRLLPVFRLFASTGIRKNELVELRFSDIDFKSRCIVIRASVAKSKKTREIPLDDEMFTMLKSLSDEAKFRPANAEDYVFVTQLNTPLKNNLLRIFYAICKKANIDGASSRGSIDLHSLRVTFTTLALENGASPKAVQSILGHSTLAMTMGVYAKATEKAKRDAVSALPFAKASPPEHVIPMQSAHSLSTDFQNNEKTHEIARVL